jgi:hypothetical protein
VPSIQLLLLQNEPLNVAQRFFFEENIIFQFFWDVMWINQEI